MDIRTPVRGWLSDKAPWIALGVMLAAAFLRFYNLTSQPLWYDELATISLANVKGGLTGIWSVRFYPHPPLFAILLHFLFRGFVPSEFSARLIPVFGGLAAFPLLYRYAAEAANRRTALIALLLLAVSPFHIFFCQDARPYTLMFPLVVLTLWVLHKALESDKPGWWVAHALCLVSLLYLHFSAWSIVVGEVLYLLLCWRGRRRNLVPFALSLSVCVLALPPVYNLLRDSQSAGRFLVLDAVPVSISFSSTWKTLVAGEAWYVTEVPRLATVIAFGLLALTGCICWAKHRPRLLTLMLSMLGVPFLFVFVVLRVLGHVVPPYEERQFVIVLPFALMLAAGGAEQLWQALRPRRASWLGRAIAACLLAVLLGSNLRALYHYYTRFEKNLDIRVIEYLASRVESGDVLICQGSSMAMNVDFHWDVDVPVELVAHPRKSEGTWLFSKRLNVIPADAVQWDVTLNDVLSHPRVWLVTQDGFDPPQFASDMQGLISPASVERLGPFSVYLFVP